jgi:hypothetical protein
LLPDEQAAIERLSEQVKRFAGKVDVAEGDGE